MTRQAAWDKFLVAKVSLDNKPSCFFRIHPLNRFVGNIHNRYPSPPYTTPHLLGKYRLLFANCPITSQLGNKLWRLTRG